MVSLADPRARERLGATVSSSVDFQSLSLRQIHNMYPRPIKGSRSPGFTSAFSASSGLHYGDQLRLLLWGLLLLAWQMAETFPHTNMYSPTSKGYRSPSVTRLF